MSQLIFSIHFQGQHQAKKKKDKEKYLQVFRILQFILLNCTVRLAINSSYCPRVLDNFRFAVLLCYMRTVHWHCLPEK